MIKLSWLVSDNVFSFDPGEIDYWPMSSGNLTTQQDKTTEIFNLWYANTLRFKQHMVSNN